MLTTPNYLVVSVYIFFKVGLLNIFYTFWFFKRFVILILITFKYVVLFFGRYGLFLISNTTHLASLGQLFCSFLMY
ncbi:MAG: hypothetical protein EAY66_07570 [Sphingobacteriales bacterium]|nr:MAG: hypothetical protein EAY66_07570 [Sphingobacteriales bacterium]